MFRICIQMVRITFEGFEFAFDCFESRSNGSNLHSNEFSLESPSNGSHLHYIARILYECFEFAFDYFESRSNASNLHSNGSN